MKDRSRHQTPLGLPGNEHAEYAQPLMPSWVLALVATLIFGLLREQAQHPLPMPVARQYQAPAARLSWHNCGPGGRMHRVRADGYRVELSATVSGEPYCVLLVRSTLGTVLMYAGGEAAYIRTGRVGPQVVFLPEGGWWQVPVAPYSDAIVLEPALRGLRTTITVYAPSRLPGPGDTGTQGVW